MCREAWAWLKTVEWAHIPHRHHQEDQGSVKRDMASTLFRKAHDDDCVNQHKSTR